MLPIAIGILAFCIVVAVLIGMNVRGRRQLRDHAIDADTLHALLKQPTAPQVYDVRQSLDLLAHSEIIPGAVRIAPEDILARSELIPKDSDAVVYCTCSSQKTSLIILRRALALRFTRIKFLEGGLDAWKAKGYPVEPYTTPFTLNRQG